MQIDRRKSLNWLSLPLIGMLVWWIYRNGLYGDFLFDDFANMPALGSSGPVTHWSTFFRYITSGGADLTGRPLTLLTFLIDGHNWPTAAYPFKRTNLVLHLLNGGLLALFLTRLGEQTIGGQSSAQGFRLRAAAITAATLWMIHPLLVSTVLYVVQREAMLPMTFTVLGLLFWMQGRRALLTGDRRRGVGGIVFGLVFCTLLAVLSKPNGMLLPLFALVIEYVLLSKHRAATSALIAVDAVDKRLYRTLFLLLAWLPAALVVSYLIYVGITGAMHGLTRPWTIGQRLMTEPRILFQYLDLLWVPRPFTPGLFNDQWIASTSLWSPITTALSLGGLAVLLAVAWQLRRRYPFWSLAILFFFAAQLIESSTIPLELYYEHRNYVAAMLMFWPLSLWLWGAERPVPSSYGRMKLALLLIIVAGLASMTRARADLWGNSQQQALLWATLNPASPRAQANAANHEMAAGNPQAALARLTVAVKDHPDDPQITLNILSAHCAMGGLTDDDRKLAGHTFAHLVSGEAVIFSWLGGAIEDLAKNSCKGLTPDFITGMLDAASSNPRLQHVTGRVQDLDHLRGELALSQHQPQQALDWFNRGLALRPGPQMAFEQAASLGSAGYPAKGLEHLDYFVSFHQMDPPAAFGMPSVHAWVLRKQNYWGDELVYLRKTLQDDVAHSTNTASP